MQDLNQHPDVYIQNCICISLMIWISLSLYCMYTLVISGFFFFFLRQTNEFIKLCRKCTWEDPSIYQDPRWNKGWNKTHKQKKRIRKTKMLYGKYSPGTKDTISISPHPKPQRRAWSKQLHSRSLFVYTHFRYEISHTVCRSRCMYKSNTLPSYTTS